MTITIPPCPVCGESKRFLTTDRLENGFPFLHASLFVQCRNCKMWRDLAITD